MKSMKIAAIIPMRHESVRVKGKNYRMLAGKPLYQHIIDTLLLVPEINTVVVDTDSPLIMDGIRQKYPGVQVLVRPEHLRADWIPMNEVLMNATSQIEADLYLQTHSTNPLLKTETISRAVQTLVDSYPSFDTLFSVTRVQSRLWDSLARPINHNAAILLRTQDLPPVYEENSCLYLFTRQTLEQQRNRIGLRPYLFTLDPIEAWDIDEEVDFVIADLLLSHRLKTP
jgi:CMP-N-acetylneuraminic acid synthetase